MTNHEQSPTPDHELDQAIKSAELRKLELEAGEIEKRLNQRWYKGKSLVQYSVVGIVSAVLIVAWIVGQFKTILESEQRLAAINTTIEMPAGALDLCDIWEEINLVAWILIQVY